MGVYISLADIGKRIEHAKLVQLTDDAKTGNVNEDVVNEIIADAEGTFDSYARQRYTLPVAATQRVKSICLDIAAFKLQERRATTDEGIYKVREKAHDKAIAFLKDLATGKAALDIPASEETKENPASPDRILSGPAKEATFSDDKLSGF